MDSRCVKRAATCAAILIGLAALVAGSALDTGLNRPKRAATARLDRLWDDAVIPYEIDPVFSLDRAALFRAAMRHWENHTCIKFVERRPEEHRNYIVFTERSCGCCSFVGKRGNGPQAISIGKHCDKFGIIVHELGHVVGFWHEHTRPDRDQHVQIISRNIMNGQEYNFNKLTRDEVNSLGLAYDYDSILHYATNTFARETHLDTILPLHGYLDTEQSSQAYPTLNDTRAPSGSSSRLAPSNGTMINDEIKSLIQRDIQSMLDFPALDESSPRVKREANVDIQNDQHMLAIDGLLAKTRPEIGQRVRLSVGDIAQTNLLYRCPKCGHTIQQPTGIFYSPSYFLAHDKRSSPDSLSHFHGRDFCEWRLSVGFGERVMLNITDLDLGPPSETSSRTKQTSSRLGLPKTAMTNSELHDILSTRPLFKSENPMIMPNCDNDYLEVRDGYTYRSPIVARLCGHLAGLRDLIKPIVSTSNRMLVTYKMSSSIGKTRRGFLAQHEALCGGVVMLGESTSSYSSTSHQMTSYRNNISGSISSVFRYYPNGTSTSENEVPLNHQTNQRTTGSEVYQSSYKPSTNQTSQSYSHRTYKADIGTSIDQEYSNRPANLNLSSYGFPIMNSTTLQSPNWPDAYRPSKECIWQVKAADNHRVALKFEAFDLEHHDSCAYDYIEIRDGETQESDLIGRYCGLKPPSKVLSSSQTLFVKFVSDSDVNRAGFLASLQSELDHCKLGLHDCSHKCINVGDSYLCGCPDGLVIDADGKSCLPACGGLRNESYGKIISPNFPNIYPFNSRCLWEIKGTARQNVMLNFTYFDLEGFRSKECDYDYVEIKSKLGENSYVYHGRICGYRQPFVVASVSNEVILEFVSDNSVSKSGFMVDFHIDENECATDNGGCQHSCLNNFGSYQCICDTGYLLNEDMHTCSELKCSQYIVAPAGTIRYPILTAPLSALEQNKQECSWTLSTMPGHRVQLLIDSFSLDPGTNNCTNGNLAIYDGLSSNDPLLKRLCASSDLGDGVSYSNDGSIRPPNIISSINSLYLNFQTPNLVPTGKFGFNATHSTVCGGRLQAVLNQNDLIYSHPEFDGESPYRSNEDCEWLIECSTNQRIKIDFTFVSLEYENKCNYDRITVYDGPDEYSARKAQLCGSDISKKHSGIISSGESMLIVFKSDDSINSRGFSLVYTAIETGEDEPVAITDLKGTKYGQSS